MIFALPELMLASLLNKNKNGKQKVSGFKGKIGLSFVEMSNCDLEP
jgi:hypothetical protein